MTTDPARPSKQRWRVVIVDDNPSDRADARRMLLEGSERRYEFVEAETGAAGVRAILESPAGPPHCVILDYHLPDASAPEVLAELTSAGGLGVCPILVITGSGGATAGREVLRAGAQDFVSKEWITAGSLTRAVENAVERWAMARELRARDRVLQALADNTPSILARFDRELRHVFVNVAVEKATGRPAADFLGKTHRDLGMPADVCDHWDAALRSVFRTGQPATIAFEFSGPSGEQHYESQLVAEPGQNGAVEFVLSVAENVTLRRRDADALSAALRQAQHAARSRDELLTLVSHDLKSPLNALMTGISLLQDEVGGEGRGVLVRMGRQVERMDEMIGELVDVAQLQAGMPLALELRETDLTALTRALADEHQHGAPNHRIEVRAAAAALVGAWDPRRLNRVVNNLLSNALKYSPGGGRVQVDLESAREGGATWALLRVRDDGIGIAARDQARVFQWYSRGENALRTTIQGTGIGLAGVRDIVEQHGGTISVESEEGKGSTFTVRLPTRPPPPTQSSLR